MLTVERISIGIVKATKTPQLIIAKLFVVQDAGWFSIKAVFAANFIPENIKA